MLGFVITLGGVIGHHIVELVKVGGLVHEPLDDLQTLPFPLVEVMEDIDPAFLDVSQFNGMVPINGRVGIPIGGEGHPGETVPGFGVRLLKHLVWICHEFITQRNRCWRHLFPLCEYLTFRTALDSRNLLPWPEKN